MIIGPGLRRVRHCPRGVKLEEEIATKGRGRDNQVGRKRIDNTTKGTQRL